MYRIKDKNNVSLYQSYSPRFKTHLETELKVYIARSVGEDVSQDMRTMIGILSKSIVRGLIGKEDS